MREKDRSTRGNGPARDHGRHGRAGDDRIVNRARRPTPSHDLGSSDERKAGLTGHMPFRENAFVFDSPFNPDANARFDVSMT
jgi:hypothetical protein